MRIKIPSNLLNYPAFAGYLTVLIFVFGKTLFLPAGEYLFGWDIMDYWYPNLMFLHDNFWNRVVPWWNPYLMSGHPFIVTTSLIYPPFVIFLLLPLQQALTWYYLVHILIAAGGMYRLCRKWLSAVPSWFAGIVYAFSGFFFPRILAGEPPHIAAAALIPLVIYETVGYADLRSIRQALPEIIKAGIFWGLMILAGDQRIAIMAAGMMACMATIFSLKNHNLTAVGSLFTTLTIGLGVGAAQIIPLTEYVSQSIRGSGLAYEWASQGSLAIKELGQSVYPVTKTFVPNANYYPPFPEGPFYAGIIPLLMSAALIILLFIAVLKRKFTRTKSNITAVIFILIACVSFWIALGPNAPGFDLFKLLWQYIPIFKTFRVPFRFVLPFIFSISVLSAIMLDKVKQKLVRIALVILLLFELVPFSKSFLLPVALPQAGYDKDLMNILTKDKTDSRLHQNFYYTQRLGRVIDIDAPAMFKIPATNGNLPLILRNYAEFYLSLAGVADESIMYNLNQLPPMTKAEPRLLNFLSVRHILSSGDFRQINNPALDLVLDNPYRWFTLYENKDAFPRYFPVYEAKYFAGRPQLKAALSGSTLNLAKTVLLIGNGQQELAGCTYGSSGKVTVDEESVNEVRLTVDIPCPGYLVSSEVMYPGWSVEVNGKKSKILTGNLAFRTVEVPQGNSTVIYRFRPISVYIGIIISLATLMISLIVFWRFRKTGRM